MSYNAKYVEHFQLLLWFILLVCIALCSSQASVNLQNGYSGMESVLHTESLLNETICSSKECLNVGSQMLSLMNHNVGPCEDFYQHACGGLANNPEMLAYSAGNDIDRRLGDQIHHIKTNQGAYLQLKNFYESCILSGKSMNEDEARSVVGTVGKFHSKTSWMTSNSNLTDLVAKLVAVGCTPLFDVKLDVCDEDTSRFNLKLVAPMQRSLILPDRDACLLNEQPSSQHTYNECRQRETLNFIASVGEALQAMKFFPVDSTDFSSDDFQATIDCLRDDVIAVIEKYTPFESDVRRDLAMKKYHAMNITELQEKFPLINWVELLNNILQQELSADSKVQVYFEYYFHMLFRHLSEVETRLLHNALLAMFVTEIYFDAVNQRSGNRDKYCLAVTKNLLPEVVASLYLQTFPRDTAQHIEQVFGWMKRTLEEQINGSSWLDHWSREYSLEKLRALEVVAGGGRELLGDMSLLDQRMEGFNMNKTTFLSNTINLLKRKRKLTYALYSKNSKMPEPMWTYFVNPLDTSETIYYHSDKIGVPYAVLPVEKLGSVMPHFRIAEMGMTLAKLIAHHFDSTGIHYRSKGFDGILSNNQVKEYLSIKDCIWKQVSKLDQTVIKHRRDILQTVNDVIADQTALNMALKAFQADNSTKQKVLDDSSWEQKGLQLFFLSVAQATCTKNIIWDNPAPVYQRIMLPPSARINSLFSQSEAFSIAYGCAPGSGMQMPENEKCPNFPDGYRSETKQETPTFPVY